MYDSWKNIIYIYKIIRIFSLIKWIIFNVLQKLINYIFPYKMRLYF